MIVKFESIGLFLGIKEEDYLPPQIELLGEFEDEVILVNKETGELATYSRETGKRLDCGWNTVSPEFIFTHNVDNIDDFITVIYSSLEIPKRKASMVFLSTGKSVLIEKILRFFRCSNNSCSINVQEFNKLGYSSWYFDFNEEITGKNLKITFKLDWEDT